MKRLLVVASLTGLLTVPGCYLYSDDDCKYGDVNVTSTEARNPDTGLCEYFESWEGSGECGGELPPSYVDRVDGTDSEALPDWGACYGYCDGLDEYGCLATSGCRAAYVSDCPEGYDCTATSYAYYGCWQVAPSGPIQGGGCTSLGAYECSRHDDCSARHYPYQNCSSESDCGPSLMDPMTIGNFESCVDEGVDLTGCFEDYECPDDYHCNAEEVCLPSPWSCDGGMGVALFVPCDERCYGYCVPDTTTDPGDCYADVTCLADPPECPDGTLPGIVDHCYSGYCIPLGECETAPPCAEMTTEAMCVARLDCAPIYQGIDCTCDETGCTCAEWLYQECDAGDQTALGCSLDDDCDEGQKCCYPCGIPGCVNQCMSPDADGQCPMLP